MSIFVTVITAFASGVLGSALGAIGAVVMTAVAALAGIAANIAGADLNLVNEIAFGMFLGPQVSFAPACCAAAYAKKRGYLASSKDIATPLISLKHADVLLVGGGYAVFGWYLNKGIAAILPGKIDTVALTVVIISLVAKVMFGNDGLRSAIGVVPKGEKRYSIFHKNVWLPYQTTGYGQNMVVIGAAVGSISGYLVYIICKLGEETGNPALASVSTLPVWTIAVICFLLNVSGLNIPVFHHIGLVSAYAAKMAYDGGCSDITIVLWGLAFGILATYAGDLLASTFMVYGEGFVDPPSMAIALLSILPFFIFPQLGWNMPDNIMSIAFPVIITIVFVMIGIYHENKFTKAEKSIDNITEMI